MILLDTHVWLWYASGSDKLTKNAAQAIEQADRLGISAISCWEVAMLVSKKRLGLKMDVEQWIDKALQIPRVNLLPLTPSIAVLSTQLPGDLHGDPADRIIAASCLENQADLVTKDRRLTDWEFVETIW